MFFRNINKRIENTLNSEILYLLIFSNFLLTTIYFLKLYNSLTKFELILFTLFVNIAVFFIIFFIFQNKYIRLFIFMFFMFFNFIEFLLYATLKITFSSNVMQAVIETNKNESKEFLKDFVTIYTVIYGISFFLLLYFSMKFLKKINLKNIKKPIVLKILICISIIYSCRTFYKHGTIKIYEKTPATRLYLNYILSLQIIDKYDKLNENFKTYDLDISVNEENNIENIVLILGESNTRNHMSLYGYELNNNPNLISQEKLGNLYAFSDVISPHAQTSVSLQKIMTFKNYESPKVWYETPDIINVMKKAGFKTYWFSNQGKIGVHDNLAYAFASLTDKNIFNEDNHMMLGKAAANYDMDLINIAKDNITDLSNSKKNFIVFHLIGTHYTYSDRYPKDFKEFDTSYIKRDLNETQKSYISKYDTAVLYNDYVVSEIHNIFKDTNSIIIYISDHGEELYDFRDYRGHTEGNPSRYMLEIPFTIYVTDKFKENNKLKVENIKKSLNNKYMADDLPHTILDIADISSSLFEESRSIINQNFDNNRKRMYQGKDYDTYWKTLN